MGKIITLHATARAQQRGYRPDDLELIAEYGTLVPEGILLLRRDIGRVVVQDGKFTIRADGAARKSVERLGRLVGSYMPTQNGRALSIYRPCKRRLLKLLAAAEGQNPRTRLPRGRR